MVGCKVVLDVRREEGRGRSCRYSDSVSFRLHQRHPTALRIRDSRHDPVPVGLLRGIPTLSRRGPSFRKGPVPTGLTRVTHPPSFGGAEERGGVFKFTRTHDVFLKTSSLHST